MNIEHYDQALVVLNVPPSLEEAVVDWLLEHRGRNGFTSRVVHGHSTSHLDLSAAEQVSGRQRRLQFDIQMAGATVKDFLNSAREQYGRADVRYWVLPLFAAGTFDPSDADGQEFIQMQP